jgi:hypothetical protein
VVAFLGITVARAVAAPLNPNYTKVITVTICTGLPALAKSAPTSKGDLYREVLNYCSFSIMPGKHHQETSALQQIRRNDVHSWPG